MINRLSISDIQSMLFKGITFKMTKDIERYKDWHFGCKWTDAIIGQHPESNNRSHQCRMYVPKWRVLGFPDLEIFTEEVNLGLWEAIEGSDKYIQEGISVKEYMGEMNETILSEESIKKMKVLFEVGKSKLVGYLPISTIKSYSNLTFDKTVECIDLFCRKNYLKFKIIKSGSTGSGALYVWDAFKLGKFIKDNEPVFSKYNIDGDEKYISKIEHTTYLKTAHPEMYKLIGQSFSDVRFENIFEKYK